MFGAKAFEVSFYTWPLPSRKGHTQRRLCPDRIIHAGIQVFLAHTVERLIYTQEPFRRTANRNRARASLQRTPERSRRTASHERDRENLCKGHTIRRLQLI